MHYSQIYSFAILLLATGCIAAQEASIEAVDAPLPTLLAGEPGNQFISAPRRWPEMYLARTKVETRSPAAEGKQTTSSTNNPVLPRRVKHGIISSSTVEVAMTTKPSPTPLPDFAAGEHAYAAAVAANFHRREEDEISNNDHGKIRRAPVAAERRPSWFSKSTNRVRENASPSQDASGDPDDGTWTKRNGPLYSGGLVGAHNHGIGFSRGGKDKGRGVAAGTSADRNSTSVAAIKPAKQ